MRAILFTLALMGATMADTATGDDKKEEPKEKKIGPHTFNERITVEMWEPRRAGGPGLLAPVKGQWAVRAEKDGKLTMWTWARADNARTPKGSRITDAAGNVYEVAACEEVGAAYFCELKLLKAAEKPADKDEPKKQRR